MVESMLLGALMNSDPEKHPVAISKTRVGANFCRCSTWYSYLVLVVAPRWMAHCHILEHAKLGMMIEIIVTPIQ
jgi:FtsP/CotA-like multicopper oxidase with cupredoxin domain